MNNVLIWGSKSQARIIEYMINEQYPAFTVKVIFDPFSKNSSYNTKANFSNSLENLVELTSKVSHFIVCVGSSGYARFNIAQELKKFNLTSLSIISDHAFIDNSVHSGEGVQVMPGAVIHKFVNFGVEVKSPTTGSGRPHG